MTSVDNAGTAVLDPGLYREAMARLASAVHLITTEGPAGRAGFTASSVCSVSDSPPTLLVCINRTSSSYPVFAANTALCVNTLGASHQAIAGAFGGKTPMETRFAAGVWRTLKTGAPVLEDALVAFDCRIVDRHSVGSHDVLYCAVAAVAAPGEADALVYHERRYHALQKQAGARSAAAAPRAVGPRAYESARLALRSA